MSYQSIRGINHLWSKLIVEELRRLGATLFVIAPGARSAPLAHAVYEAAQEHPDLYSVKVHFDERGAGFYALGWAKASSSLAVCITTSGTAVANLLPATIEASQSNVPLLLLTADRPFELRETGANQTILQPNIFGGYVRFSADIAPPSREVHLTSLLAVVDQCVGRARGPLPGPTHLNLQFRKPLLTEPRHEGGEHIPLALERWQRNLEPLTSWHEPETSPSAPVLDLCAQKIEKSKRGVIVAGGLKTAKERAGIMHLAHHLQWPVLCDIASNLRSFSTDTGDTGELRIAHFSLFLGNHLNQNSFAPDCVIHAGDLPISNALNDMLEMSHQQVIQLGPLTSRRDPLGVVADKLLGDIPITVNLLCERIKASQPSRLLAPLREADIAINLSIKSSLLESSKDLGDQVSEWHITHALIHLLQPGSIFYLANSLPIREAESLFPIVDKDITIGVHRGASGIDGTLAIARGAADAVKKPLVLLCGDLAFLHDLNSLTLHRDPVLPTVIVVINNDGGAIFSLLPELKGLPSLPQMFSAPHGLKFAGAAELCKFEYSHCTTLAAFTESFASALSKVATTIIEVECPVSVTRAVRDQLASQAQGR